MSVSCDYPMCRHCEISSNGQSFWCLRGYKCKDDCSKHSPATRTVEQKALDLTKHKLRRQLPVLESAAKAIP